MKDKHLVPNIVQMYEYGPSVLALQSSSQDLPSFPPVVPKKVILVRIHFILCVTLGQVRSPSCCPGPGAGCA